ncbi:MAG: cold-shock protein [Candidatus Bathyarchaeota archaeon]|nr:cold-shock protein [Candidatus Bathyarchaeota archaeon]
MLRRILAERLARAEKYVPVEAPILREIPVPATMIEHQAFSALELVEGTEGVLSAKLQDSLLRIPSLEWGRNYGETAGQWYSVTFKKTLASPEVVAVGESRAGEILFKEILRASKIAVPTITIPKVGIRTWHCTKCDFGWFSLAYQPSCPQCKSGPPSEIGGAGRYETCGWYLALWNAKKRLGDWGLLNWARDTIATVFAWFGYVFCGTSGVFVLLDTMSAQVDKIQDSIQTAINSAISDINRRIGEQIDAVRNRVNERLQDLYDIWGLPRNLAITPIHVRNVTPTGFSFLSLGKTTIHWVAIGRVTVTPPKYRLP